MPEYLTLKKMERFDPVGTWVDITQYVNSNVHITTGMKTEKYDDRMASVGSMRFTLNNISGVFDLDTNFAKGTQVKFTIKWHGLTKVFYGIVDRAKPPLGYNNDVIDVEVLDWMQVAVNFKLRAIVVQTSQRIDQVITTLMNGITVKPITRSVSTGRETFEVVFDDIQMGKTSLYAELYNLVMSEMSYAYVMNSGTLRVEANTTRSGTSVLKTGAYSTPDLATEAVLLDAESGAPLLNENGGKLIFSEVIQDTFDGILDRFIDHDMEHSENVINDVEFEVYTKKIDMDVGAYYQIYTYNLYTADPPIPIAAGGSIELRGNYWDEYPSHRSQIDAAMEVFTPTEGAGTSNYSVSPPAASLTHTFIGGADSWYWKIQNNGNACNLTYFELGGRPISRNQSLNYVASDAPSQQKFDVRSIKIKQPMLSTLRVALEEAPKVIDDEAGPRAVLKTVTINANYDKNEMAAFMLLDIGSLCNIKLNKPAHDKFYWIQGQEIDINLDLSVNCKYIIREHYSFRNGLTPLAIRFNGWPFAKNVVNVPTTRRIQNLASKSISFWIYFVGATPTLSTPLISFYDGSNGHEIFLGSDGSIRFYQKWSGSYAEWRTPAALMTPLFDQWVHIVVTYSNSSTANDPVIYVNNVSQTITELTAPSGTIGDETSINLNIGNRMYPGSDRTSWMESLMKHVTYYSSILSAANVDTIYNAPNDPLAFTTNMAMQLFGAKTDLIDLYLDVSISPTRKLIDNMYQIRANILCDPAFPMIGRDPSLTSYV